MRRSRILTADSRSLLWAVMLISLAVYLVTMSKEVTPGMPANLMAVHLGVSPFPPLAHPLWRIVSSALVRVPLIGDGLLLNLLSAICGAAVTGLVFVLVRKTTLYHAQAGMEHGGAIERARSLAGLLASLALAFCLPFWYVATRVHTAPFDLLLLLLGLYLLTVFIDAPRAALIYLFSFLWGVGTTEFATFIILTPFVLIVCLLSIWRAQMIRARILVAGLLCYLLGLCLYLVEAWWINRSPAKEWYEFSHAIQIVWYLWRDQYWAITKSMGPTGWILISMAMILPWIVIVVMPARSENRVVRTGGSTYFLLAVLTALGLVVLFDLPPAPWQMLNVRPLLVTPYVLFVAWLGHLAGFWYILLESQGRFDSAVVAWTKRLLKPVYVPGLAVLLVVVAVRNFPTVDTRYGDRVHRLAEQMVEDLDGRGWLITDGVIDDNILLAANAAGVPLNVINLRLTQAQPYRAYVASLFEDTRRQSLAKTGLGPLLKEWFETSPTVAADVAVQTNPDLWLASDHNALPLGTLFSGTPVDQEIDIQALQEAQRTVWERHVPGLLQQPPDQNMEGPWVEWARGHLSKVANNLGVLLEDQGLPELAFDAYRRSREVNTNNVSALLNMLSMAMTESRPEKEQLQKDFDDFAVAIGGQLGAWGLSYRFGYVRHPEAYANRGFVWAMSGKPNAAIREIKKAMEMGAEGSHLQLVLASLYYASEMDEESEDVLHAILQKEPDNTSALLGLARLAIRRNDLDAARGYLARLSELGYSLSAVRLEQAVVETLAGDTDEAVLLLQESVERDAGNVRAWVALALLAHERNDRALAERATGELASQVASYPLLGVALAQIEIRAGNLDKARDYLEKVLRAKPSHVSSQEMLLRLDVVERKREEAEKHVEELLLLDPRNAFANFVLGNLQATRGEFALAEDSYRVSLETKRTPETLNDLAWLLQQKGRYEEALELVQESIQVNDRDPNAWDTYGVVLMRLESFERAAEAMGKALDISPDNPELILHLAQLHEEMGDFEKAYHLALPLVDRVSEMTPEDYDDLRTLLGSIRRNRPGIEE